MIYLMKRCAPLRVAAADRGPGTCWPRAAAPASGRVKKAFRPKKGLGASERRHFAAQAAGETGHVRTGGRLIEPQTHLGQDRQQMVEHVALNALVLRPG